MFMNGVMIGLEITVVVHRQIPKVLHRACSVFIVAVAGLAAPSFAILLIVTTAIRTAATTILVSACPAVQNEIHLYF